jgi:hypothetical protein
LRGAGKEEEGAASQQDALEKKTKAYSLPRTSAPKLQIILSLLLPLYLIFLLRFLVCPSSLFYQSTLHTV